MTSCLTWAEDRSQTQLANSATMRQWLGVSSIKKALKYIHIDELPWAEEEVIAENDFPDLDHDQLDSATGRDERFAIVSTALFNFVSEGTPGEMTPQGMIVMLFEERYEGDQREVVKFRTFKDTITNVLHEFGNAGGLAGGFLPNRIVVDQGGFRMFNWDDEPTKGFGYRAVVTMPWDHSIEGGV